MPMNAVCSQKSTENSHTLAFGGTAAIQHHVLDGTTSCVFRHRCHMCTCLFGSAVCVISMAHTTIPLLVGEDSDSEDDDPPDGPGGAGGTGEPFITQQRGILNLKYYNNTMQICFCQKD